MSAQIIRANALCLPLADASVDLVVTSPPYFGLRSYQDGGSHYEGQIGAEATPAEFVDALIAATREMARVVKPTGSIWVNLGDKYAGSGMGGNASLANSEDYLEKRAKGYHPCLDIAAEDGSTALESSATTNASARPASSKGRKKDLGPVRSKSLIGIPWRYALRCIDDLGLILRAEVIWSKPNGLPESVTDRVRRSHEQWFHFTLNPRYYSAVDEVRETYAPDRAERLARYGGRDIDARIYATGDRNDSGNARGNVGMGDSMNPLGKLPGSVWTIPQDGESLTRTVLSAVSDGKITVEEGERILWSASSGSWSASQWSSPAAGNGSSTATHADTPRSQSETGVRNSSIESPTSSTSDPSPTDSRSTTSAATPVASTLTTSSPSPSQRTSGERTPNGMSAHEVTVWPTLTPKSPDTAGLPSAARSATRTDKSDAGESVWVVPTEPLRVPEHLGIDHFAAYPTEFPRRIITGWSPRGVCVECGAGRRPVSEYQRDELAVKVTDTPSRFRSPLGQQNGYKSAASFTITGEACDCPESTAPTTPGVVLDPFGGTGTTALVADALGRHGISVDMSRDYCRLAEWRTTDPKQRAKAARREFTPPREQVDGQVPLFEDIA